MLLRLLRRCADRVAAVALVCMALLVAPGVSRSQPTVAPLLRVETAMHTALVRRVVADDAHGRLITAGDDKTIRIWRARDARLERVLRPPVDVGHEGQLFGLAVSPDGARVAAGGWTCWDWEGAACVYVFDTRSGEMLHRITRLPDAIGALAWSPDGRRLAVGLHGRSGVRLFSTDTWVELARDDLWRDRVMELDFSRDGWLAATGPDRALRVYRPDGRLHGRVPVGQPGQPVTARFAPDGRTIAIGMIDGDAIALHAVRDLSPAGVLRVPADAAQRGFAALEWSHDGTLLFGAGEHRDGSADRLWRWTLASPDRPDALPFDAGRVSELRRTARGQLAAVTDQPGLIVCDTNGREIVRRRPELRDFAAAGTALRVSPDAAAIELNGATRFAWRSADGIPREGLQYDPPLLEHRAWNVHVERDSPRPRINGVTPVLDDHEMARSHAIAHDGGALVLGTDWALRKFDASAREIWRIRLTAAAQAITVARNGQFVVAALADGTVRWYRMDDGSERLAWFAHANGEDWIAWTPAGYYNASPNGDRHIGWHLNQGAGRAGELHRAVQFERILWRPDIVATALDGGSATRTRGDPARFDIAQLRSIAPPRLRIEHWPSGTADTARLRIRGERTAGPMHDLTVFVNDVPVNTLRERALASTESDRFVREIDVPLFALENEIRVESFSDRSMGVAEMIVDAERAPDHTGRGDLYLLAIGNNAFPHLPATAQLEFASRDAEQLAARINTARTGAFRRVHTHVLSDDRPRKADRGAVVDALRFIGQARAHDTVVVFLASHGVSDGHDNYYLVPRDATAADMAAIRDSSAAGHAALPRDYPSLVSWTVFFEALRGAAGRRVLIVDTCHARGIEGRFTPHSLMKRSASAHFALMVAARADEESQEYAPARHGLFTHALIEGLAAASDVNRDGRISLREWFDAAVPTVERLRDRAIGPQTPQFVAPARLAAMPVAAATGH